ncbi:hypothetical protein F8S13_26935 [Chloroflexia bacterium SDU3-3]|nr:hypothetical protein F8S13_26935 [Chloroflexia bacterium SDU3-3]
MPTATAGHTRLFTLEPGDGTSYRVLFGRLPPASGQAAFVLFGLAEGSDALITLVIPDTDRLSRERFGAHWQTARVTHALGDADDLEDTAYAVFAALVGIPDVPPPGDWEPTWREQIPVAALG